MLEYNDEIKNISVEILKNNKVDMVIGYRKGTIPMVNEPYFITKPEESSLLIWDSNCRLNLANYITDHERKVGIIAKGCDTRNIVTYILENKVNRDKLYIIGVHCKGMIDRKKIKNMAFGEIKNINEKNDIITITTTDNIKKTINKKEILQENCISCSNPNPVISDILVGEKIQENKKNIDKYEDVHKIEQMRTEEKWNYFSELFSSCIRCYACKNSCPLCYCPTCFVDESDPQWLGKGTNPIDIKTFHFLRAYHCAGRCTDCGSCEQVCPVEINMRILTRKLAIDCKKEFNWNAGLTNKTRPPLDIYSINDSDSFIK